MTTVALEFSGLHGAGAVLLIAGAVAGALLTLGALVRAVWRGIRRIAAMADAMEVVEKRSRELIPNGGGSIKDRTEKAADRLSTVEAGLREVRGMVAAVSSRLDTHLQIGEGDTGARDPQRHQ